MKTKQVKSYLKYKQWLQWKRKPSRAGDLVVHEKTKLSNYTPKLTPCAITSWNKTWPTSLKRVEWEFTGTHSSCIQERMLVGKTRPIQPALNKGDEPWVTAGKPGVKAASDSQRLHSCFECLIVSILSHIQIYWGKQGECTFFLWEKEACTSCACVCVHTHINKHRCMQGVALRVKQTDSFTPLMDLCLTGVSALVSFIFTTRIISGSQHISKDCYVDSYSLHRNVKD